MTHYSLTHVSNQALLRDLAALVAKDRLTTAELLAHLAEVDARKLYVPAGYPSMRAYCVQQLGLCEQAAFKRIHAARTAREFPAIFPAVAEGRLHLSAVVLLASHLTPDNADELLAAAARKSKSEIERLLAERSPQPDVPTLLRPLGPQALPADQLSPGIVGEPCPTRGEPLALGAASVPGRMTGEPRPWVTPLAPGRFGLQFTMSQELHDKLCYAQELLGHQVPAGDVAEVFERALDALIPKLERRKFAATDKPRQGWRRATKGGRYIPAQVKRAVWGRDGGQCTFVSESGQRCSARGDLEFDHVQEVARGGECTVANLRLRCRAHNQYEAEQTFGAEFMNGKRQEARKRRAESPARASAAEAREREAASEQARDVFAGLRELGVPAHEARRAAEFSLTLQGATLEDRLRAALQFLCRRPSPTVTGRAWPGPLEKAAGERGSDLSPMCPVWIPESA